jgi:hypothetical protein
MAFPLFRFEKFKWRRKQLCDFVRYITFDCITHFFIVFASPVLCCVFVWLNLVIILSTKNNDKHCKNQALGSFTCQRCSLEFSKKRLAIFYFATSSLYSINNSQCGTT